jgi:PKD repeat protein
MRYKACQLVALMGIFLLLISPVMAQDNPFRNIGEISKSDIAMNIDSGIAAVSNTSQVTFTGAGYTHTIGRVSIHMKPLMDGVDEKVSTQGNTRTSGTKNQVNYKVYKDMIKEEVVLNAPETVKYSYDLSLSDWVTTEPDLSRAEEKEVTFGTNKTKITTYPHRKTVTNYGKDSTIDISPDAWGNLVVLVNGADVVVLPKPFATDAAGTRFELDYVLDKEAKTITITGDLAGARYPVTVDPTERVTNGGFEAGIIDGLPSGWVTPGNPAPTLTIVSDNAYEGTYYCLYQGNGGYNYMTQNWSVDYTYVTNVSVAAKFFQTGPFGYGVSQSNNFQNPPANYHFGGSSDQGSGWVVKSATPSLTGNYPLNVWSYAYTSFGIDAISANAVVPPVANFTASPTSGTAPLTVQFTDTSSNTPTAWNWSFGDGSFGAVLNPSHTYANAGTYTVGLTARNAGGSSTETKTGYVMVTSPGPINYYVFADGVALYHNYGTNTDVPGADTSAEGFYEHLATAEDRCHMDETGTNYCWNERSNPVNDATGSIYWSQTESANSIGANSAEFVYHAGHGWDDGILFGTPNNYHHVFRSNMSFSRTKWAAFDSCSVLNASNQENWDSVFDGLHILMSYETTGLINEDTGPQFVERMKGGMYQGTQYLVTPIRYAWRDTLRITVHDSTRWGAYKYADPSGGDYLPGYGSFTEPVKTNGQYTTYWEHFQCI